jgi:hypothetical protein
MLLKAEKKVTLSGEMLRGPRAYACSQLPMLELPAWYDPRGWLLDKDNHELEVFAPCWCSCWISIVLFLLKTLDKIVENVDVDVASLLAFTKLSNWSFSRMFASLRTWIWVIAECELFRAAANCSEVALPSCSAWTRS